MEHSCNTLFIFSAQNPFKRGKSSPPIFIFSFVHNQLEELISVSRVLNESEVMVIREALSFFKNKFSGELVLGSDSISTIRCVPTRQGLHCVWNSFFERFGSSKLLLV